MTEYTSLSHVSIFDEVLQRLGRLSVEQCPKALSERSERILIHYQRTWARSRRKSPLYLDTLITACIANLAGTNGIDSGREVRL